MMALQHNAVPMERQIRDNNVADEPANRLLLAGALLPDRPDEAALLLDGLPGAIVEDWFRQRGVAPVSGARALDLIQRVDPLFGWRLRLALRAPDAQARLAHCAALLAALHASGAEPWKARDER